MNDGRDSRTPDQSVRRAFDAWGVAPPGDLSRIVTRYPFRATDHLLRRIRRGRPRDPIALQCLPRPGELAPGADPDPTGDRRSRPVPGLVRKHRNRAVLLVSDRCLVNCRFCFRKAGAFLEPHDALAPAFRYLEAQADIQEVILSGGDPLALDTPTLTRILDRLRAIPHLRLLRIHTRALSALPARVTPDLVQVLRRVRPLYLVLHTNHPQELSPEADEAIARLLEAGVPLLNQSVLLRGINDDADTLAELSWALLERGVTPYYLHHCDRVPGTSDFWINLETGASIHAALATRVPGHGLPRYVVDLPGGAGKVPVSSGRRLGPGAWRFPVPGGPPVDLMEPPIHTDTP